MSFWTAFLPALIMYLLYMYTLYTLHKERGAHWDAVTRSYQEGHDDGYRQGYADGRTSMVKRADELYALGCESGENRAEREHSLYGMRGGVD